MAGMKSLDEEEMEEITAAGDSVVVVSEGGAATFNDNSIYSLALPEGAQEGLRALTVQNVVGEVQLLVNLNVLSASGNVNSTDQRNFAVQSWGSTLPDADTVKVVDGVAAAVCPVAGSCDASGAEGGAAGDNLMANGGNAAAGTATGAVGAPSSPAIGLGAESSPALATHPACGELCFGLASTGDGGSGIAITGDGGNGGDATAHAAPGGNGGQISANAGDGGDGGKVKIGDNGASTSPGVVSQAAKASGDVIVKADQEATVNNDAIFSLAIDQGAQTNMGSLFIANIVGRAQTAFNINIAASTLNLFPSMDGTEPFTNPLTNATGTIKQVNSGVQFRGTPIGVGNTNMDLNVNHTPN
jgi:hypothetical protein